jgi:predicted nucleic acid-binding protein
MKIDAIPEDPQDNKFITAAIEGEADYIVSGDHHLRDLKNYQGISIVSPSEFLQIIGLRNKG